MAEKSKTKTTDADPASPSILTVEEVARYLRVHQSTVYRLLKRKELPAFRVGSDWRFNIESIDKWRFAPLLTIGKESNRDRCNERS